MASLADHENFPMYSNRRNATVLVHGEKEVLWHYIKLADAAVPLLGMGWQECKKVVSKQHKNRNDISDYINSVVVKLVKKKGAS